MPIKKHSFFLDQETVLHCNRLNLPPAPTRHHPVTKARRLRGRRTQAKTLALAAIALVLLLAPPSRADEEQRERIPGGCRELADRGGLPLR